MISPDESLVVIEALDLARACLCASLAQITNLKVTGVSGKPGIDLAAIAALLPRLILVSMIIPGFRGIDCIRCIKRAYPKLPVLALVANHPEDLVRESLRAGADGYILKNAAPNNFDTAIRSALCGRSFTTSDKAVSVLDRDIAMTKARPPAAVRPDGLSARELEVLTLVASALSNNAIAKHLGLSLNTVETYRKSLRKKLDAHNAADLTAYAIAKGWRPANPVK